MKHILVILLSIVSVTVYSQSPRIKLNQIVKDNAKGSILISSPTDSQMVYSRDFFINFGTDTTLVLFGDTIGGGISTVVTDLFTIQGDGSVATPLYVDTSVINTIKGMVDTLTARGYLTTEVDGSTTNEIQTLSKVGQTVSLSLSGGSFTDDVLTEAEVDAFVANNGYLTAEVDGSVTNEIQDISTNGSAGNISISSGSTLNLNVNDADASATNEGALTVQAGGSNDAQIQSNTSGSTNVTIAGGSNVTVTESGNTITIASTASGGGGTIPVDTFVTIEGTETITGAKTFSQGIVVDKSNQGEYFRGDASTTGSFPLTMTSSTLSSNGDKHTINASGFTGEIALASDGTEILTISSDNKVGILNNGPGANLDVRATGSGNDNAFLVSGLVGQNLLEVDTDGDLIVDTSTLYVDATNNKVGIGTSTPQAPLSVAGSIHILDVDQTDGTDNTLYIYNDDDAASTAGSTDAEFFMSIAKKGSGSLNHGPQFLMRGNDFTRFPTEKGLLMFGAGTVSGATGDQGSILFATGGAYRMKIAANGNVGIGATSPEAKFTVLDSLLYVSETYGAVGINQKVNSYNNTLTVKGASAGTGDVGIKLFTDNTGTANTDGFNFGIQNSTLDVYINQRENADLFFVVNGGTRFAIEPDGDISIGGATVGSNDILMLPNSSNARATAYAWDTYSDERIKSNFESIENAISKIKLMNPQYYIQYQSDYDSLGNLTLLNGFEKTIGFVAQELISVLPEAVNQGVGNELWSINYTKLIPITVKAIQEQQAQIETQQNEIDQLKTLITDLTNRLIILENK